MTVRRKLALTALAAVGLMSSLTIASKAEAHSQIYLGVGVGPGYVQPYYPQTYYYYQAPPAYYVTPPATYYYAPSPQYYVAPRREYYAPRPAYWNHEREEEEEEEGE